MLMPRSPHLARYRQPDNDLEVEYAGDFLNCRERCADTTGLEPPRPGSTCLQRQSRPKRSAERERNREDHTHAPMVRARTRRQLDALVSGAHRASSPVGLSPACRLVCNGLCRGDVRVVEKQRKRR